MAETAAVLDRAEPPPPIQAAWSLAASLRDGCRLEPLLLDGVPLIGGEHAYAELDMTGWRWLPLDSVEFEQRALLFGGPVLMCATGLASAVGNRRRRREAERAAAPQWRPLGPLRVVVTERRLVVWHGGAWWSVWLDAIRRAHADPAALRLDLVFHRDAPYRLEGSDVPVLAVVLAWLCR
jgi:hypothetical protein